MMSDTFGFNNGNPICEQGSIGRDGQRFVFTINVSVSISAR
jgi:hypothetical protein